MRGKGLPNVNRYGTGDLLVNVGVYIPEKLNKEEKEILEKLKDSNNIKPSAKARKSFFTRFRGMFN